MSMTNLQRLEAEITSLPDDELKALFSWLDELRWERWDRQFEQDVAAGKLDALADQAMADMDAGRCTPL